MKFVAAVALVLTGAFVYDYMHKGIMLRWIACNVRKAMLMAASLTTAVVVHLSLSELKFEDHKRPVQTPVLLQLPKTVPGKCVPTYKVIKVPQDPIAVTPRRKRVIVEKNVEALIREQALGG